MTAELVGDAGMNADHAMPQIFVITKDRAFFEAISALVSRYDDRPCVLQEVPEPADLPFQVALEDLIVVNDQTCPTPITALADLPCRKITLIDGTEAVWGELEPALRRTLGSLPAQNRATPEPAPLKPPAQEQRELEPGSDRRSQMLLSLACRLATLKPDKIDDACREFLPPLMRAGKASGYRFNPAQSRLELGWCVPDAPVAQYIPISPFRSDSPSSLAVNRRHAWYAKDVGQALADMGITEARPHADRYETTSCIVAPIVYGAELLGVINFADPMDEDAFEQEEMEPLVEGLTHLLAATWQNVGTVESLEQLARTDGLTGLANFRAFEETITREVTRSRRYGLPLSLILMDVDNLKQVNDRFGHAAGDLLLREVARRVSEAIRETDVAARQGGDEFSVVLPNTTLGATGQVAARIEEAVNGTQVQWLRHVFETSVSMAFGQYDGQATVSGFVTEVDSRLYRSKSCARVAL